MQLNSFLAQFNLFTEAEIGEAVRLFTRRTLKKGSYFVREGEKCSEVAFVESGVFRSFYVTSNGNEMTYCFRFPGEMVAAYSAFITGNGSVEYIQALADTELLVIPKDQIDQLLTKSPAWIHFLKIIAEQQYLELEGRVFQLQRDSAQERYENLIKEQPEYIRQISVQHLASYLGITQRHLSRIRKQLLVS
ncbi:MAG: putative transcriptional regulator, Crp/Fnr family [Fluviicola sp.]|jgi:CRP-like cAMP-binding protein|uniref:Crp/Fnr family transcriptional regulator n=1 Tax=Fluviicola sp. TaxID=1917219 RepID=UPI00261D2360|nr:Crp/Fnr family transcriptional regulator [Fluviicola sp.]MDF3025861.1 putative transcriptional regulator, Crp/Fnr family [Fluviicola sp.]